MDGGITSTFQPWLGASSAALIIFSVRWCHRDTSLLGRWGCFLGSEVPYFTRCQALEKGCVSQWFHGMVTCMRYKTTGGHDVWCPQPL